MINFKLKWMRMQTCFGWMQTVHMCVSSPFSALWKCLLINMTEGLRVVPEMKVCSSDAACNSTVLVLNQNVLERHFFFKLWFIRAVNWSPSCLTSVSLSVEFGGGPVYSQVQSPSVANAHPGFWPGGPVTQSSMPCVWTYSWTSPLGENLRRDWCHQLKPGFDPEPCFWLSL